MPSIAITNDNAGPLAGSGVSKAFARVSLRAVDSDIVNAYAHFWSAAFEKQLGNGTVASIEYSGSAGRALYGIYNLNRAGSSNAYLGFGPTANLFGDGPVGVGRLNNNGAAAINWRGNGGRSNYNAMILSFDTSRLRNLGLRLGARYTYAINRDNLSSTFSDSNAGNFQLGFLDPFNPDLDYGSSENDVRHRFVTNFTWDIPSPKEAKGWVRQVVGGWQINGIYSANSGPPFSVWDCAFADNVCSRAILDGAVNFRGSVNHDAIGVPRASHRRRKQRAILDGAVNFRGSINHDSIGVPDVPNRYAFIDFSGLHPGSFRDHIGQAEFAPFPANMSKRNAFRGPGFWNMDASLYKNFQITESKRLQLRFEVYNAFNHANLYLSTGEADISSTSYMPACFGCSGSTADRRNVQLAAKFIF